MSRGSCLRRLRKLEARLNADDDRVQVVKTVVVTPDGEEHVIWEHPDYETMRARGEVKRVVLGG